MNKNDFAKTPPRGWNSYDFFDTAVTEDDIKAHADYMADHLKEYGYEYVVVDIQWYAWDTGSQRNIYQYIPFGRCEMDAYGRLLPCPQRFPSSTNGRGFKPLADYVHDRGLKFGIHIMRGIPREAAHRHLPILHTDGSLRADMLADPVSICDWNPDMYGLRDLPESQFYYDSIMELYASWGVDFIKCDDICNTHAYKDRPYMGKHEIEMLHRAIMRCGREIVLSLSPGPALISEAAHYCRYANMWRISDDFWDNWQLLRNMFDYCEQWQYVISEGCWPDCDMLPLGRIGGGFRNERETDFTREELKTMFALWCLFKSPLIIGANLTMLDTWTEKLLTNRELLSLQEEDWRPRQAVKDDDHAVWFTDSLEKNSFVVAVFNFRNEEAVICTEAEQWRTVSRLCIENRAFTCRDLYSGNLIKLSEGRLEVSVPAHGVRIVQLAGRIW